MANKDQKRGNKETRKPKQTKAPPVAAISPFIITPGKSDGGKKK
jgi:hypothetical protein